MSWRGQGRRARGRRGDPEHDTDNTAWLEELERAAAEPDDQEEEWSSKLRRRRRPQDPGPAWPATPQPPAAPEPPQSAPAPGPPSPPLNHDLSPYPPLGGEQLDPPPPAPEPYREPDYRLLGMEPESRHATSDWDTGGWSAPDPAPHSTGGWSAPDPAPRSTGEPAADWLDWAPDGPGRGGLADFPEESGESRWGAPADLGVPRSDAPRRGAPTDYDPGSGGPWNGSSVDQDLGGDWRPAGSDTPTGAWSPGEPTGREPDYPALFGELNRRRRPDPDPLWDSPPATEPAAEPGSFEPPAPAWPFEETTQTWEPSDRSFIWPAEELPATTSDWEPSTSSWLDEPTTPPPTWAGTPAGNAAPGAPPPLPPDDYDWAAGIHSGVPPVARGTGTGVEDDYATRMWRPDEVVEAEPAVPLGAAGQPPTRQAGARVQLAEEAPEWELEERPRRSWPKAVAIISWIVLLMVVCWFYVFPWLEGVLPENF
jgi:hypothetical protein